MGTITGFRGKSKPRPTSAMEFSILVLAQWVSALDKKSRDHSVKRRPVEKFNLCEVDEIFNVARSSIGEES